MINVCFLLVLLFSSFMISLLSASSLTPLLCLLSPRHQSSFVLSHFTFHTHISTYLPFFPTLFFFFVLQASELGMTSAFYKYILTTMVRTFLYLSFIFTWVFSPLRPKCEQAGRGNVRYGEVARGDSGEKERGRGDERWEKGGGDLRSKPGVQRYGEEEGKKRKKGV